jgi:hypothetical protein
MRWPARNRLFPHRQAAQVAGQALTAGDTQKRRDQSLLAAAPWTFC